MRTFLMGWFLSVTLFAWGQATQAQEQAADGQRLAYPVKNGNAEDFVPILSKHFKGQADFTAMPKSPANLLLINAAPAVQKEISALLAQLDRKPREIAVDVWIGVAYADSPGVKPKEGETISNMRDFNGPKTEVVAKLEKLQANGRFKEWKHFQTKATENQPFIEPEEPIRANQN
jgi:hypothetical protein